MFFWFFFHLFLYMIYIPYIDILIYIITYIYIVYNFLQVQDRFIYIPTQIYIQRKLCRVDCDTLNIGFNFIQKILPPFSMRFLTFCLTIENSDDSLCRAPQLFLYKPVIELKVVTFCYNLKKKLNVEQIKVETLLFLLDIQVKVLHSIIAYTASKTIIAHHGATFLI